MVLWALEGRAPKVVASVRFGAEVAQADFNPNDANVICVTGNGMLKVLKVAEGTFKAIPLGFKREAQQYTCHVWLPGDQLVACTAFGEVLLFANFEFKAVLVAADGEAIHSIAAAGSGFVVGGKGGTLRVFERAEDPREWYVCRKTYRVEGDDSAIVSVAVAPSEETLVCSSASHMSYSFALGSTDLLRSSDPGFRYFEFLTGSEAHGPSPVSPSAAINDMDVCIWKPLLISCGRDHCVRLWNYEERTVELSKRFHEEPLSVALHPSGFFAVVGFSDKVRLLSVLMNDLATIKEFPVKTCRVASFSQGGHVFAIANQSAIQVFDTYTCALRLQLRGHQQAVRAISWADRDRRLVSTGKDGNVFLWDARTGQRIEESMQPRTTFVAAALAGDASAPSSRLFAVAADMTIRSFSAANMGPEIQLQSNEEVSCLVAAPNGRTLFVGTAGSPGTLVSYMLKDQRFPGKNATQIATAEKAASEGGERAEPAPENKGTFPPPLPAASVESQVVGAHSTATTAMCLSNDGRLLFSGGDDGSLCIFEVREVDARGVVRLQAKGEEAKESKEGGPSRAQEVLVTKTDLLSKKRTSEGLAARVEELKVSSEHQQRQKEMAHRDRVRDVTDKFTTELAVQRTRYGELTAEREALESSYEDQMASLRVGNTAELEQRQAQYRDKVTTERLRKDALVEERKRLAAQDEFESAAAAVEREAELAAIKEEYGRRMEAEQAAQATIHGEKNKLTVTWSKERVRIEDDSDREVEVIKSRYEQRLLVEQETTTALKGEHVVMKKKYQLLLKEVKEQEEKIKGHGVLEKQLQEVVHGLDKDIVAHKKEVESISLFCPPHTHSKSRPFCCALPYPVFHVLCRSVSARRPLAKKTSASTN